jgi:hypothetical protein
MSIQLNPNEQLLRAEIQERMEKTRKAFAGSHVGDDVSKWILEAGERAHRLHMSLKNRGLEPRHHAYMIKNRELPPDDPQFYMHFHPIEDLLKFLADPHANDDPIDQTLGHEFTFAVYSRRWGHDDTYTFKRTADGWTVEHAAIGGPCDKGGHPFLYKNLEQDLIQYPHALDGWLEWLWNQAAEKGLPATDVQSALGELASWVNTTEKSAPAGGVWKDY